MHVCITIKRLRIPLAQVQAVLGHASIETTRGYARSYDGTVATDYAQAMARVERELGLVPADIPAVSARIDELIQKLLHAGPLNDMQIAVLSTVEIQRSSLITQ
jgi:hypothetical protein